MTEVEIIPPPLSRMKRQQEYSPARKCIYCGGDGSPGRLTPEHIIPESLGGMLVLPQASCKPCQDVTSAMEGQNAGRLFRPIRRQLNSSKSRGRARREARQQEEFVVVIDGRRRYVSTAEYPGLHMSFVFPLPTILLDLPPDYASFSGGVSLATLPKFGERLNALRAKYGSNVSFPSFGSAEAVGRLLAKIGHSYAAAEVGIDCFRPYLLGIIRNQDPPLLHHVVGSAAGKAPVSDDLHEIEILPPGALGNEKLVVVKIHLFSNFDGMTVHYVVAGERL